MIEINSLSKKIRGHIILNDISYQFQKNHIYGVQGINGSGKTMLLRSISGLIKPSCGSIVIDGKMLWRDISFPPSLGVLIENPSFLNEFTGRENLDILASLMNNVTKKEIDHALTQTGLSSNAETKYRKYSLGMKQKLGIAAAILGEPEIILLDEPTNALDGGGVRSLISLLKKMDCKDKIIIVCSHNRKVLGKVCDIFIRMKEGAFVE